MDKTVVVAVEDRVKHPRYAKVLRRTNKLHAHDEANECGVGDRVLLMETRPTSASKRWRVVARGREGPLTSPFPAEAVAAGAPRRRPKNR